MLRFPWSALVTPSLLGRIRSAAGLARRADVEPFRDLIAGILANIGGLPVVERRPSAGQRTDLAARLLHEAVRRVLREIRPDAPAPGYRLDQSNQPLLSKVIHAVEAVPVNRATADEVATTLDIPASTARALVEERRTRGPFRDLDDLDDRVRGIGPLTRDAIAAAVRFDTPDDLLANATRVSASFEHDLGRLVSLQPGTEPTDRLAAALDFLLTRTAASPHPDTAERRRRPEDPPLPAAGHTTDFVGLLVSGDYYRHVPELIGEADASVEVCMFHVALPSPDHPTHTLLDSLVRAKANGATVRVLLDSDREDDPYLSTVINTPAKDWLEARGIAVRFDSTDRLLHSKFVVLDGARVVIGSHNWSAGSYFRFDDLSVVVESASFGSALRQRFEALWAQAGG